MDQFHGLDGIDTSYERKILNYRPDLKTKEKKQTIQPDNQTINQAATQIDTTMPDQTKKVIYSPDLDTTMHIQIVRYEPSFDPVIKSVQKQIDELGNLIYQLKVELDPLSITPSIEKLIDQNQFHELFELLPHYSPLDLTQKHHHLIIASLFQKNSQALLEFWNPHMQNLLGQSETTSKEQWLQKEQDYEAYRNEIYRDAALLEDEWQGITAEQQKKLSEMEKEVRVLRAQHQAVNQVYYPISSRMETIQPLIEHMKNPVQTDPKESTQFLQQQSIQAQWIKHLDYDLQNSHQDLMRHYHGFKMFGPNQYRFVSHQLYPLLDSYANDQQMVLDDLFLIQQQSIDHPVIFDAIGQSFQKQRDQMQQTVLDFVQLSRLEADSAYLILRQSQKMENLRAVLQNFR